jgi:predicted ATP-grasp superfamily ATP-dependent carboligase
VADCFGDSDTLAAAERWQLVPPLAELSHQNIMTTLSELAHGQHCMLVCGSGIEQCYLKLFPLPANIQLVGNTPDTIHRVKTPSIFFHILSQQGFNYPATIFQPPTDELHWLKKKASGLGGSHIEYAAFNSNEINTEYYYQRFISGRSGSCLFLADGYHAQLLTVNQQFPATDSNSGSPFLLARIESAWTLSASQQHYLNNMINQLTAATMLVGLNSLDFML